MKKYILFIAVFITILVISCLQSCTIMAYYPQNSYNMYRYQQYPAYRYGSPYNRYARPPYYYNYYRRH